MYNFEVSDHYAKYDKINGIINERLVVNGNQHIIFDNLKGGNPPVLSIQKITDIINLEAESQQVAERAYLSSAGVFTSIMLLTPDQFRFFNKVYNESDDKPLTTEAWIEMFG